MTKQFAIKMIICFSLMVVSIIVVFFVGLFNINKQNQNTSPKKALPVNNATKTIVVGNEDLPRGFRVFVTDYYSNGVHYKVFSDMDNMQVVNFTKDSTDTAYEKK